eukprot:scaffold2339_cov68-Cyclotella_meneghiniana.AAC.6
MSLNKLADAACRYLSPNADHAASHQCTKLSFPVPPPPKVRPQLLRKVTPDYTRPTKAAATLTPSVPLIRNASHLDISARRAKKNDVKHRARRSRGKDTSVSFAEMTRLMNTYGPIKCLRNRSNKNPDKEIKAASILRKFYRWFPDFEDRFVRQADGRYVPKIGHEKEIEYREMMRGRDEKFVVTKRNMRRYAMDVNGDPMDGKFGRPKLY